ncbi:MAG: S-adenosylmethionine decarboxylase [Patescibacteria group bacterium]
MKKRVIISLVNALHIVGTVRLGGDFAPRDPEFYLESVKHIITEAGLTIVGSPTLHRFDETAFTLAVLLAESHVSMHTWYELGLVHLDVFTCGMTKDNSDAARQVFNRIASLFDPIMIEGRREIVRH